MSLGSTFLPNTDSRDSCLHSLRGPALWADVLPWEAPPPFPPRITLERGDDDADTAGARLGRAGRNAAAILIARSPFDATRAQEQRGGPSQASVSTESGGGRERGTKANPNASTAPAYG